MFGFVDRRFMTLALKQLRTIFYCFIIMQVPLMIDFKCQNVKGEKEKISNLVQYLLEANDLSQNNQMEPSHFCLESGLMRTKIINIINNRREHSFTRPINKLFNQKISCSVPVLHKQT